MSGRQYLFPRIILARMSRGICVTSLDTYAAGCIHTFISRKGHLDDWRVSVLEKCRMELETVVPNLDGEARTYFKNLLLISERVLQLVGR
jgi:hypothetical protein